MTESRKLTYNVFKQKCLKCQKIFLIAKNLFFIGEHIAWNCKHCGSSLSVAVTDENGDKIVVITKDMAEKKLKVGQNFNSELVGEVKDGKET